MGVVQGQSRLRFGMISGASTYYEDIREGWEAACAVRGVYCEYITLEEQDNCDAEQEILDLWKEEGFDGVALKSCEASDDTLIIDHFTEQGLPIVTFDRDVSNSTRLSYVGTRQGFVGETMARILRQMRPDGGTFGVVCKQPVRYESFVRAITKYNNVNNRGHWFEIPQPYDQEEGDLDRAPFFMQLMERFVELQPSALLFMCQLPMEDENWTVFVDKYRDRNITLIGVDGADFQLEYLNKRYVDGLVSQIPFEIGSRSLEVLHDFTAYNVRPKDVVGLDLVAYNLIPIELPPLTVDNNRIGNLKYLGYTAFGAVALCALFCIAWTIRYRQNLVVKAAQPFFLLMITGGVLVLASSLIPLSMDDGGDDSTKSTTYRVGVCMSVPWLAFIGFTVTFSALFSKTWRVNRIIQAKATLSRIKVETKDVLGPFFLLLTCNILVLTLWTVLDPLTYTRNKNEGTDYWNRVISTHGSCESDKAHAFLAPLAGINWSVIVIACYQAYEARSIKSEFSEAKYIGLALFSLFQAFITGIPVLVIVRDSPQAYYISLSLMITLLSLAVLVLIFVPKIMMQRQYAGLSEAEQRRKLQSSVVRSSNDRSSSQFANNLHLERISRNVSTSSFRKSADAMPGRSSDFKSTHETATAIGVVVEEVPNQALVRRHSL
ncbi:gamma-aminobutyric acid type B receptor [Fistulifera solaris]|uniref:Gamma-aminobutyric acid type B receptor n=1 Tax=Fistulifera solaris TaxID=1519565 RepID=A0A1Z5KC19_FISSO|nr:gamma-aminobutyric acid type B receptor [Fistulifera solaris]|eukprot:GAX23840.1 gamma-aminobutyric acid type B receptor [Fistulifera solaris]